MTIAFVGCFKSINHITLHSDLNQTGDHQQDKTHMKIFIYPH